MGNMAPGPQDPLRNYFVQRVKNHRRAGDNSVHEKGIFDLGELGLSRTARAPASARNFRRHRNR